MNVGRQGDGDNFSACSALVSRFIHWLNKMNVGQLCVRQQKFALPFILTIRYRFMRHTL